MRIQGVFLIAFILFLPLNNILADALDKKAEARYQAMEQEVNKLLARREKAMEEAIGLRISKRMAAREKAMDEALSKLMQKKIKQQFFFTQKPNPLFLGLGPNLILVL